MILVLKYGKQFQLCHGLFCNYVPPTVHWTPSQMLQSPCPKFLHLEEHTDFYTNYFAGIGDIFIKTRSKSNINISKRCMNLYSEYMKNIVVVLNFFSLWMLINDTLKITRLKFSMQHISHFSTGGCYHVIQRKQTDVVFMHIWQHQVLTYITETWKEFSTPGFQY